MKKLIVTFLIVFASSLILFPQSFYRYQGQKIDLRKDTTTFIIQSSKYLFEQLNTSLEEQLQQGEVESFQKMPNNRFFVRGNKPKPEYYSYFSYLYLTYEDAQVIVLQRIAVMLQRGGTLQNVLEKFENRIVSEHVNNQKYILTCNVSSSDEVLQLVAELDSLDDVIWCEPEFLSNYAVTNPLYPQQYYLKNTGQDGGTPGIDINVEPAWDLTNGNTNIVVAVVDVGVDRDHEDMGNRVLEGYTIRNPTGGGLPQNANDLDLKYHGMACAGIIAASNNSIGIRGVASEINVLPVNIVPDEAVYDYWLGVIQGFGTNLEIAEAINWTWRHADILSCSWGGGAPSNDITSAIDSALTYGRNGRGAVVVFSSGNSWPNATDVAYPGNLDGVITVGAITNQGSICNYSQRGASMDLVAPSGNISSAGNVTTTDRMGDLGKSSGNYITDFGGTSAACPQVSAVAALLLSVNPNLSENQVRTILQSTANDMGASGFDTIFGYGRVNAYAAVIAAAGGLISGPIQVCTSGSTFSISPLAPFDSIHWDKGACLSISSGQGTTSCTFVANCYGSSYVSVTVYANGHGTTLPQKTVYAALATPPLFDVSGPGSIILNSTEHYVADIIPRDLSTYGIYYYDWSVTSKLQFESSHAYRTDAYIKGISLGFGTISFYTKNGCGTSTFNLPVRVVSSKSLSIYPNPASNEITIEIDEEANFEDTSSNLFKFRK